MAKQEFWRIAHTVNIKGLRFEHKTLEEYTPYGDPNHRRLSKEKLDEVRIQVEDNWGNKIYTDRAGANKIYKALKNNPLPLNKNCPQYIDEKRAFEIIRGILND